MALVTAREPALPAINVVGRGNTTKEGKTVIVIIMVEAKAGKRIHEIAVCLTHQMVLVVL